MLTFNQELTDILNTATTKLDWANKLKTALGTARRIICKHDSNSAATDVFSTGTMFLEAGLQGEMIVGSNGNIAGYGPIHDIQTNSAVDLSTGIAILRIAGNGHWVQGTLGLTGASTDFTFNTNPTGNINVGFTTTSGVRSPRLLNSGTGPLAPSLGSTAPYKVVIEDWSSGSAVVAGEIVFNNRIENWVFDDPDIASNIGDVRVMQSSQSVTLGDFEFGAILFSINGSSNSVGTDPVHQVLVGCKPTETNWSNYPTRAGYQTTVVDTKTRGVSKTFPTPFKAVIMTSDGTVLYTHEMRDGLAINAQDMKEKASDGHPDYRYNPIRPLFNCGQLLPWQSVQPKYNSKKDHWFPGFRSDHITPWSFRQKVSTNPAFPLLNFRTQRDSLMHWHAMPKWSLPGNVEAATSDTWTDNGLYSINTESASYGSVSYGVVRAIGWGYEPGSCSGHDWYTGPGGVRSDRSTMSSTLAAYFTDPNYVRPRNSDSIEEMFDHYSRAYFNIPCYHLTNVKTWSTVPQLEVAQGQWSHGKTYYGANESYVSGGTAKTIPQFAIANGASLESTRPYGGAFVDMDGRMPWNGATFDFLHNYTCPGWIGLLMNNPMYIYAQKHRGLGSIMCQLLDVDPTRTSWFLTRQHAWIWLHYMMWWKLSSNHEDIGMNRNAIEDRFRIELEAIHDNIYVPVMVDNSTTMYSKGLRNLGVPVHWTTNGEWSMKSQALMFYLAQVLQTMRQIGLWTVMRNKSDKCNKALLFIIKCMDTYTFDWVLDTDGRQEGYVDLWLNGSRTNQTEAVIVDSWAHWAAEVRPKGSELENWVTKADGTKRLEQDAPQHLRAQYAFIRRDYFADIPCARGDVITTVCDKFQEWYDTVQSRRDAIIASDPTNYFTIRANDWSYRYPALGIIKAPTNVEP